MLLSHFLLHYRSEGGPIIGRLATLLQLTDSELTQRDAAIQGEFLDNDSIRETSHPILGTEDPQAPLRRLIK